MGASRFYSASKTLQHDSARGGWFCSRCRVMRFAPMGARHWRAGSKGRLQNEARYSGKQGHRTLKLVFWCASLAHRFSYVKT
ncbi:hypothetical protein ABO01nite_11850 [Asaia bogorensis NBRC 16594]|uniref:Uncharacterized protein n=1 Tax=Asaia bogorensis NBRC 16594 TaxID=1231624 RepID=A0AAN4R1F7_9PROT|nr:hypothetical protein ABO01nite_11850 [Asaia bogorensis NBRC 16594]